ncbi:MAG: PAS domain S-box protein [Candidatus Pacebacteria bacterium]|nr:PAS domain S-box protein [Candidatus Paceibacterota bacterium]
MKIRTKIILPIVFTALVVLSAATFYSYFFNVKTLEIVFSEHLDTAVSSRTHHIDTFLESEKEKIKMIASSLIFKRVFDEDSLDHDTYIIEACKRVDKIIETDSTIYELSVLGTDGEILCSSSKESIGLDKSDTDYFINGLKETYIKDAYYSESTGKNSMAISTPIMCEKSGCLGVMVSKIEMSSLNNILSDKTGLKETGNIYIINKDGYAITPLQTNDGAFLKTKIDSENTRNCLKMFSDREEETLTQTEIMHKDHEPSITYINHEGVKVIGSHHITHLINWCVIAEIDESEAFASTKDLLKFSIIRITIILFLFFVIAFLLAKNISEPITKLRLGTEIIKKGNLNYKVGTNSKDEIGALSRDFDEMTLAIKKSQAEIDQKVKHQTEEIIQKQKNIEDQQLAILNVLEDVENEKKLTEIERDKIDTILHSIGDGVFVVDKNKKITIFNEIAEKISGFTKEEVLGKNYLDILKFIHEKDRTPNNDFIEKAFTLGKIQAMKNHTLLIKKDKTEVPVADSSAPIKDSSGKIIGCIIVFRDASAERKAEQIKSDFVSIASHQLRTPLTGIQWVTERLLKNSNSLPEKEQQYVKDINLSSKRLSTLVDSLLNVSRIEGGKITIKPEKIELIDFIKGYITETNPLTTNKNIQLTFDNHPEKLEILSDRSGIRNIVQSLVSNSIEYTPQNGKIEISVEETETKDSFLFKVKDSGIGIPKQNQKTIFDKFTRGENAQQVKTDGTGFGLYITKQTTDLLGGTIRFESEENKGTTFFVTLPKISKAREGGKSFV